MREDTPCLDTSFHDHEMAVDTRSDRAWYRFIKECERLLGVPDLDGNEVDGRDGQPPDAFSLDGAYEFHLAGKSAADYAAHCQVTMGYQVTDPTIRNADGRLRVLGHAKLECDARRILRDALGRQVERAVLCRGDRMRGGQPAQWQEG